MPTVCVDTNIWIYALCVPKEGDTSKHQIAQNSIQNAMELRNTLALSYWDSLVVAAAPEAGCNTLISEDMQHQQQIDGLRIINPFK
jgi:predicted nucleic acid-binding protein